MTATWTSGYFWRRFYTLIAATSVAIFACDVALAQRGRGGGGEGGHNQGGGGGGQSQRGGGGGARVAGPGGGGGGVQRAAPSAQAGGSAGGQARAAAPGVRAGGGARAQAGDGVHVTMPNAGAAPRAPAATGGASVNTPAVRGGAQASGPGNLAGGRGRAQGQANVPQLSADGTITSGARTSGAQSSGTRTAQRPNLDADTSGNARRNAADAVGRAPANRNDRDDRASANDNDRESADRNDRRSVDRDNRAFADRDSRASADRDNRESANRNDRASTDRNNRAAANFTPSWHDNNANLGAFRTTFGNAMNARYAANRANRAAHWNNWAGNVRNGFYVGANPYFGNGFWSGRNLIGYGIGNYGLGGYGLGGGLGGYGGLGNWWGYSPWLGNRGWSYWYGNPGWNSFANNYGWSTPYYYDYGPQGNIVYSGDQVLVNGQSVGTPDDYAQSAAELATVTQEEMNAPHDWMPLGTFSVATSQEDTNPARVAQLAYDNKQGLISGTILNRESNNLYTVQGKVDPQTQRVAFTIGKDPNIVLETGLYNLTQKQTPVLVHFGPEKTATYLFVRLPEPDTEQGTTTASAPGRSTASPTDDSRR